MKKLLIPGVIVVSALIAGAISSQNTYVNYVNFNEAREQHEQVRVAGFIVNTRPVEYNPEIDSTRFSFYMQDETGYQQRVIVNKKMPFGSFNGSEKVVLTGTMEHNDFVANEMLIKCVARYHQTTPTKQTPAAAEIYSITEGRIDTEWK